MRRIVFLGDSRDCLRAFPADAKARAGFELREVQKGNEPTDWKPMKTVGVGVREIRVRAASGVFRVFYVIATDEAFAVLHAFQKKTRQTTKRDIALASRRLEAWRG